MKRIFAVSLILLLAAVPFSMADSGVNTISFDFDFDQYVPVGGETEEKLQEKAIQYILHYYIELGINNPVWSPDGSKIAFIDNYSQAIHMISPDGSGFVTVDDEIITSRPYNWIEFSDGARPSMAEPGFFKMKQQKAHLAFTPDGKEITYTVTLFDESRGSYINGGTVGNFIVDIESIDIATGEMRTLVDGGMSPAWSPDGRYLAYVNFDYRIYTDPAQAEYNGALAILDTQTGEVRYPVEYHSPDQWDNFGFRTPSFSPDGSEIAFMFDKQLCTIPFGGGEINYLTDIDNDDLQWFGMSNPQYSPDGRWILFWYGWRNTRGMMVYDTADGKVHMVADGKLVKEFTSFDEPGSQFYGTWSPDGTRISALTASHDVPVGSAIQETVWELSIVDFDPAQIAASKLSLESTDMIGLAFGSRLPVSIDPVKAAEYLPSTSIVPNTPLSELYRWKQPQWSPDGKLIAFAGNSSVNIVSINGGDLTCIAENFYFTDDTDSYKKGGFDDISFTPDGRKVSYTVNIVDTERGSAVDGPVVTNTIYQIESADIFTGETKVLVEGREGKWSPDGRYLVFINFDHRIYTDPDNAEHNFVPAIYDTDTGEIRYLANESFAVDYAIGEYRHPVFSNDGSLILLVHNGQLCTIPFEGGAMENLTSFEQDEQIAYGRPMYSPDGDWIIFNEYTPQGDNLLMFHVESGKTFWLFDGSEYIPGEEAPYSFNFVNADKLGADALEAVPSWDGFGTLHLGSQYTPSFSPDGSKILYVLTEPALQFDDGTIKNWLKANHSQAVYETESNNWLCGSQFYIADFNPTLYDTTKPTSVEAVSPVSFAITGNYPNPFNPSTTIEFSIPVNGLASVDIFNSAGQKIRELVSTEFPAGSHAVVWDGRDASGLTVSSGVYIARLKAGNFVAAKQMMMMK